MRMVMQEAMLKLQAGKLNRGFGQWVANSRFKASVQVALPHMSLSTDALGSSMPLPPPMPTPFQQSTFCAVLQQCIAQVIGKPA